MHIMHIENLELTQLRLLEAIHEQGSISAAAEAVGLSQSAASHSLARLRETLGDPLFVRSSNGMVPTHYGERICQAAHQALIALREALHSRDDFDPTKAERTFRLYMNDVGQMVMLPRLSDYLRRHAPGIDIRISALPDKQPGALLESGEVDLAVGHITTLTTGFHQRLLFREHYVCAVAPDNPRFSAGMTLEAFGQARHAVTERGGMAHWIVDRELARYQVVRQIGLTVPDFMVLPFVIPSSDLVLTMPSRLADHFAGMTPLRLMPPPVPIPSYEIRMFWHERAHHDPANAWLRQTFLQLFREAEPASGARPAS